MKQPLGMVKWPKKRPSVTYLVSTPHGTFATDAKGRPILRISTSRNFVEDAQLGASFRDIGKVLAP